MSENDTKYVCGARRGGKMQEVLEDAAKARGRVCIAAVDRRSAADMAGRLGDLVEDSARITIVWPGSSLCKGRA